MALLTSEGTWLSERKCKKKVVNIFVIEIVYSLLCGAVRFCFCCYRFLKKVEHLLLAFIFPTSVLIIIEVKFVALIFVCKGNTEPIFKIHSLLLYLHTHINSRLFPMGVGRNYFFFFWGHLGKSSA